MKIGIEIRNFIPTINGAVCVGNNMKPENMNPKAREAFGKSLIDIGVAIFKSLILLFTVVPLAAFIKASFTSEEHTVSLLTIFQSLSLSTYLVLIPLIVLAFCAGHMFRAEGIKHIHEVEQQSIDNSDE